MSGRKSVEHTDSHLVAGMANKESLADLPRVAKVVETTGWEPSCECTPSGPVPCVALDPFAGSGTVMVVARRLGRRSVGIELKEEYVTIARRRCAADVPDIESFAEAA